MQLFIDILAVFGGLCLFWIIVFALVGRYLKKFEDKPPLGYRHGKPDKYK